MNELNVLNYHVWLPTRGEIVHPAVCGRCLVRSDDPAADEPCTVARRLAVGCRICGDPRGHDE
jgi:hypothetical protein